MPKLFIKAWAEEDRPREKLLLKGIASLSDAELLAIIISVGNAEETAVELSRRILSSVKNNLNSLGKLSVDELVSGFKGIGKAKAISIVAALELGKRRKNSETNERLQIKSSVDIFDYFYPILCDLPHEEFWVLFLDRSNKIIGKKKISQGGIFETVVDSRLILKEALVQLATGLVLCHNHPSGNRKPSNGDDMITRKLKDGAKLLELDLLDHVIVCDQSYYSYADDDRL